MFQRPPPNAKKLTAVINILLPEFLSTDVLSLLMPLCFKQLSVGLTFHVDRDLPTHTPGRGRAGQHTDAVAGRPLRGSRRPHPSAQITGVAWRAIGTGPRESVTKATGSRHAVPALVDAVGDEPYAGKTLIRFSHTTQPVWVVLEALGGVPG